MSWGDHLHRDEIPPGTLYLLILKTLARSGEMHGYEIANSIQRISYAVFCLKKKKDLDRVLHRRAGLRVEYFSSALTSLEAVIRGTRGIVAHSVGLIRL